MTSEATLSAHLPTPHQCRPRLDSSTSLTCRHPPAHLYQPQKPHRVHSVTQPASKVNQFNPLAGYTASHHPVASPRHGGCPPSGFQCLAARAAQAEPKSGKPPASSRSEIQFPPSPAERDAPRKQAPRHGRRRRVRAGVTKQNVSRGPPPRANTTRVCACLGPSTRTPGNLWYLVLVLIWPDQDSPDLI